MESYMKNILFLIIDMQNGFINQNTHGVDERILDFLEQIKGRAIVAGTRYVNNENTACYVFEGWKDCMAGTKEAEIIPTLVPIMEKVFDKDKVVLVPDHFTPNKDIKSAENSKAIREYAKEQGLTWYFEQGKSGVEHAILPEAGVVVAGECIIGADSHTCTYGALGAFSTGVGSTDMAAGMATGKAWFKVPSAIRVTLTGSLPKWVSGKDVILHLIGKIGVDGALYKSPGVYGRRRIQPVHG